MMNNALFSLVSSDIIGDPIYLQKGERLFEQTKPIEHIYSIISGRIKLVRNTIDGTPVVLHIGQVGETIAEASLFSEHYHCSAIADIDCELVSIKRKSFLDYLENNPSTMRALLVLFSHQVRELRLLNEIKNIRSAQERILTYIRSQINDEQTLELTVSLKDTAHKIGLSHESFYRELKKLTDANIISRHHNKLTLL